MEYLPFPKGPTEAECSGFGEWTDARRNPYRRIAHGRQGGKARWESEAVIEFVIEKLSESRDEGLSMPQRREARLYAGYVPTEEQSRLSCKAKTVKWWPSTSIGVEVTTKSAASTPWAVYRCKW